MAGLSLLSMRPGAVLAESQTETRAGLWDGLKASADRYLGRPYVWGAVGLKSFDCSGFVWRVLFENGILIKRTTARKLYMCLPKVSAPERQRPGNIVFFNSLKHCGIVAEPESFYHAETTNGTRLSRFTSYWRNRVSGYRALPG
ncbi:MAG: C40 family peptidase [Acidobacteria bacterium]|nr:C40 family peptidase [Acidobacteriota bacterium]